MKKYVYSLQGRRYYYYRQQLHHVEQVLIRVKFSLKSNNVGRSI